MYTGDAINTGQQNTWIGYQAGTNMTTGNNNTFLGNYAQASSTTVSNEITLGDSNVTSLRCAVTSITSLSDQRDKTDITPINVGLDFVKDLNPVTFRWDKRSDYEDRVPTGQNKLEELTLGFLAQEVEEVLPEVTTTREDGYKAVRYEKLVPLLIEAIKELSEKVERLEREK